MRSSLQPEAKWSSLSSLSPIHRQFAVRDTGIGIPVDKQAQIFKAFVQADASMTRRFGGTGLGLAICTRLVQAMGGQLQVNSRVGEGSEFYFQLELAKASAADDSHYATPVFTPLDAGSAPADEQTADATSDLTASDRRPLRILLAEDSYMNQVLAIGILEREGHFVTVANDGQEAVEAFQAQPFDLILMDVQMPELDGLQATAMIREIEAGGRIPILAMTAHALTGDRERCLAAGMDGYLAKPIRLKDLVQAVQELELRGPARVE
jgi:CheY-like chemotaxis protein